ncbi:MAG: transposase [Bacteroidales bacterium]
MMKQNVYYSEEMKLKVIEQVLSGGISMSEASRRYKIGGKCTVSRWISNFMRRNNPTDNIEQPDMERRLSEEEDPQGEIARLKTTIKQLEEQLEYEKLRSEAYETMIQIAEKEFRLPIKKKFGAKQSRNSGKSDPDQG